MVEIETKLALCCVCGKDFQSPTLKVGSLLVAIQRCCDWCVSREEQNEDNRRQHLSLSKDTPFSAEQKLELKWQKLCPPLYLATDQLLLHIPAKMVDKVLSWVPAPKGIGLSGATGVGKTRLMFLLLRRLHFENHQIMAISGKRFEKWCHRMFDEDGLARKEIERAHSVPILFLDDIGKEKYTERVESEFYDLIEHRVSHLLPILWTTNSDGQRLTQMLGEDRGAPIIRRLREFTEVISL